METNDYRATLEIDDDIDIIHPENDVSISVLFEARRKRADRSSVRGTWRAHPFTGQWKWIHA